VVIGGEGVTKNAKRREKRTSRKMSKRYKLRRNKLFFILQTLAVAEKLATYSASNG